MNIWLIDGFKYFVTLHCGKLNAIILKLFIAFCYSANVWIFARTFLLNILMRSKKSTKMFKFGKLFLFICSEKFLESCFFINPFTTTMICELMSSLTTYMENSYHYLINAFHISFDINFTSPIIKSIDTCTFYVLDMLWMMTPTITYESLIPLINDV